VCLFWYPSFKKFAHMYISAPSNPEPEKWEEISILAFLPHARARAHKNTTGKVVTYSKKFQFSLFSRTHAHTKNTIIFLLTSKIYTYQHTEHLNWKSGHIVEISILSPVFSHVRTRTRTHTCTNNLFFFDFKNICIPVHRAILDWKSGHRVEAMENALSCFTSLQTLGDECLYEYVAFVSFLFFSLNFYLYFFFFLYLLFFL
jgi:hypothetical protein